MSTAQSASVPIHVRGRYLWRGDKRFVVRGVAYQVSHTHDPIADDCLLRLEHDVALFKELGLNTLYVFGIESAKPRTRAMKLLEDAGIYVLTSVTTPLCAINRFAPYDSYNPSSLASFFAAVDAMAVFPNTLGIFAASLVVNNRSSLATTPVIKAVVRDLKTYMRLRNEVVGQRVLPVGYDAAGTAEDKIVFEYLAACNTNSAIDFWAVADFSTAPDTRAAQESWDKLAAQYNHPRASLPIFISQYGAKTTSPRAFHETTALYSPRTTRLLSGGCAYEFWNASNRYGLLELVLKSGDARVLGDVAGKVAERRQTERGTVLVFWDFVNYKARLDAVGYKDGDAQGSEEELEELEEGGVGGGDSDVRGAWPWEPEGCEPESCVDWEQIRARMEGEV